MTNKKLLKEISAWERENIITPDAADTLRERYSSGGKNTLITIFSILGSVLIGTGVVLLFATNWKNMSLTAKTLVSFLPLVIGQGLAVFTVARKYGSTLFRESAAILYTAGIFATVAMISSSFRLGTRSEIYVLICALMCLPVIYLLDAVSPLIVYYTAVIFWGIDTLRSSASFSGFGLLVIFILLGMLFSFITGKKSEFSSARYTYTLWLSVAASFFIVVALAQALDANLMSLFLGYFAIIFAIAGLDSDYSSPFRTVGSIGCMVIIFIFSINRSWDNDDDPISSLLCLALTVIFAAAAVIISVIRQRGDIFKLIFVIGGAISSVVVALVGFFGVNNGFFVSVAVNIILIAMAIGFIARGAIKTEMITTNIGLVTAGGIIAARIIDDNIDIVIKSLVFIAMGSALLLVNRSLLKKKRSAVIELPEVDEK